MGAMDNRPCWAPSSAATNSPARKLHRLLAGSRRPHRLLLFDRAVFTRGSPARTGLPSRWLPLAGLRPRLAGFVASAPASTALAGRDASPLFSVALPPPAARRQRCLASVRCRTAYARASAASQPPHPRQLPLAGRAIRYRARALRPLQQPRPYASSACGSHRARCRRSCPTRIGEISKTRDAPRDEGRRQEVLWLGKKTRGSRGRRRTAASPRGRRRSCGWLPVRPALPSWSNNVWIIL
ncbi:hypothetical protein PAHAL_2G348100 [Panicum hallii]|jgi:hypothetical protein|uniref:Uncharacterized protein n=1 Tax=Panicum hallii TaxID=206008 RepID=A0A2T8KRB8_9POAL|nr:hypothetical protein PAHAL_2G348100 [Panicum hallii]